MWDAILDVVFSVVYFFFEICADWGLAIILVTVIFRLILMPLMIKQTKSSFQMQKVQPLMAEIQNKYKNDQARMQEETQKLYAEAKFNPLSGCLPMIIQMPIFIALFQVLRNFQIYLLRHEGITEYNGTPLGELPTDQLDTLVHQTAGGFDLSFYNIVPDLISSPSMAFEQGIGEFIPYLVLMIIFAGATFLPMILQQRKSQSAQKRQTMIMAGVMSIFMLFISWTSPAGVLLFWGTSSLIALTQQQITMRHLRRKDAQAGEEVQVKPIEVDVTRKVKKAKPTKKGK